MERCGSNASHPSPRNQSMWVLQRKILEIKLDEIIYALMWWMLDNGSVTPDIAIGNCLLKLPEQILEHAPHIWTEIHHKDAPDSEHHKNVNKKTTAFAIFLFKCLSRHYTDASHSCTKKECDCNCNFCSNYPPTCYSKNDANEIVMFADICRLIMRREDLFLR